MTSGTRSMSPAGQVVLGSSESVLQGEAAPGCAPPVAVQARNRRHLRPVPSEAFSAYSHLAGAFAALVGAGVLVVASRGGAVLAAALVYGVSTVLLFSASAIYHALKEAEGGATLWRRLDHLAIFLMIAGSYTPICVVNLDGAWRWSILGVQWGLVVAGIFIKLFAMGAPRWLTVGIYLAMGWVGVVPMPLLLGRMSGLSLALLGAGGLFYSAGAVIYAFKRPDPLPGRFGFHEVWHLFVLAGAALHYGAIYLVVT